MQTAGNTSIDGAHCVDKAMKLYNEEDANKQFDGTGTDRGSGATCEHLTEKLDLML